MQMEEKLSAVAGTVTLSIGNGYYGRLGHGDWISRPYFAVIDWFLKQNISICKVACTAGSTIALSEEGHVYCCGKNHLGQLGLGTTWDEESVPKKISFDSDGNAFDSVESIWAGESQVFAKKKNDGSCWCWGAGYFGVLGLPTEEQQTSPVKLPQEFVEFASGSMHTIARDSSGNVWTTGKNVEGQLGYVLEAGKKSSSGFRMVEFFKNRGIKAKQIGCGKYNSAVIDEDGRFWIWGKASEGSLGQDVDIDILREPTQVVLDDNKVVKMAFGMHHYLLLTDKFEVLGFGLNAFSQLGLAEPKAKVHRPTKIESLKQILLQDHEEISRIGCSYDTSFVISKNGRLYTWGHNWYGKNGVGKHDLDDLDVEFPTVVSSLKDLRVIDCAGGNESLLVVAEFDGNTAKLPRVDMQRDRKINQSRWEYPIQNKYHPTEQELKEMDRIRFPEKYPIPATVPPPPPPPAPAIKRN